MSRILIVEDEEILRDAYSIILSSAGYEVATAGNGNEGIEQLIRFKPDLILLDMLMPESNGLDFLQRSDINHAYPNIRVILFSNLSDAPNMKRAQELGSHRQLLKSTISPKKLIEVVGSELKNGSRQRGIH